MFPFLGATGYLFPCKNEIISPGLFRIMEITVLPGPPLLLNPKYDCRPYILLIIVLYHLTRVKEYVGEGGGG